MPNRVGEEQVTALTAAAIEGTVPQLEAFEVPDRPDACMEPGIPPLLAVWTTEPFASLHFEVWDYNISRLLSEFYLIR